MDFDETFETVSEPEWSSVPDKIRFKIQVDNEILGWARKFAARILKYAGGMGFCTDRTLQVQSRTDTV